MVARGEMIKVSSTLVADSNVKKSLIKGERKCMSIKSFIHL